MRWVPPDSPREVARRFRLIGEAPALLKAVEIAMRVAPTDVPVLILGENGTGKEIFAHMIHQLSRRRDKVFLAINCGAIPEGTMDSELFGHERGAFTSAYESRKGYFEVADGGTLFLDEIGEMPLNTQARLLRVLETGEFIRVGSSKVQKANVRIIAATNRNLVQLIQQGKFREDLFYRLNTVTLHIPPLRERGRDIELLFEFFADEFRRELGIESVELTPEAVALLYEYPWPGNVRELRHFVERIMLFHPGEVLSAETLRACFPRRHEELLPVLHKPHRAGEPSNPQDGGLYEYLARLEADLHHIQYNMTVIQQMLREIGQYLFRMPKASLTMGLPVDSSTPSPPLASAEGPQDLSLESNERRLIEEALRRHHGNRKRAAQALGISERTLYRKIEQYALHDL
ncbi:MAG: sigma 54-interacting transcriptional regulator [Bacteroidia bacterium]|nr:sigma 54-interacting transcriptional regulator [Bacteroidia bacterium]MDW8235065.1 sigma 54-interacting transcriptional regulator [Bacteroidia bacterium]